MKNEDSDGSGGNDDIEATGGVWPEWLQSRILPDKHFAKAYEAAPAPVRAGIKKAIAQLFEIHGPDRVTADERYVAWRQGFLTWTRTRPLERVLILPGAGFASPSMLLAAVLPAVCAGVENILTARAGRISDWPPLLLTALELAGQEAAATLKAGELPRLLDALAADPVPTGLIVLGPSELRQAVAAACVDAPHLRVFAPVVDIAAGILDEAGDTFDFEMLRLFLPDAAFYLAGKKPRRLPEGFVHVKNGLGGLAASELDVLFAPGDLAAEGFGAAGLVLGPGQEGSYLWPSLTREFFLDRKTYLG